MFAGRMGKEAQGKPMAAQTPEDDDDAWLRVGRSFKAPATHGTDKGEEEQALQVYKKPRKHKHKAKKHDRHRDSGSSGGEKDGRRRTKHHKKRGKKEKKSRRRRRARGSESSSANSSSSSEWSDDKSEPRSKKRRRRDDKRSPRRSESLKTYRRRSWDRGDDQLALVEEPERGELEIYRDKNGEEQKLFEVDTVGDKENIFYGTLYTHEQPLYHLATKRSLADGKWVPRKSIRPSGDIEPRVDVSDNRYFGAEAKRIERKIGTKRLHMAYSLRRLSRQSQRSSRIEPSAEELSFIPLDAIIQGELDDIIEDGPGDSTRSPSDEMLWQTDLENIERFFVARNKQLNQRVSGEPENINAWLDLIAFQRETHRLSIVGNQVPQSQFEAAVLDKQRAILTKALEHNPNSSQLHDLQLNLLWRQHQTQPVALDSDSYRVLIEQLLETNRTSKELWMKLIRCSQQKFSSFSMTMLRDLYARVLSVLNKELAQAVQPHERHAARNSSTFIHVLDHNSLLHKRSLYDTENIEKRALNLATALLQFHKEMTQAELSGGYIERAIAHFQALLHFNGTNEPWMQSDLEHQRAIAGFSAKWNSDIPRVGEIENHHAVAPAAPTVTQLEAVCRHYEESLLRWINPPPSIRSQIHTQSLLDQHIQHSDVGRNESELREDPTKKHRAQRREWVYSNLHGYRIWIVDANETEEYERILHELRGTEKYQLKEQKRMSRLQTKIEEREAASQKLRDERADYEPIEEADEFVQWLSQEHCAEVHQWQPLRFTNPSHTTLIEHQPDRAILTEELLPFIFRVPRVLHVTLFTNYLDLLGVKLQHQTKLKSPISLDSFDEFKELTEPIVRALSVEYGNEIALSASHRLTLALQSLQTITVDVLAAIDPAKIRFIRSIFASSLERFSEHKIAQFFRAMWMEYEYHVVHQAHGDEKASMLNQFRLFCQALLQAEGPSATVDAELMATYASIELRLGNERQAARVCDKTLSSLQLGGDRVSRLQKSHHRVLFVRLQQILSQTSTRHNRALQALYLLWQIWHSSRADPLDTLMKNYRKKPDSVGVILEQHREKHGEDTVSIYRVELRTVIDECTTSPRTHIPSDSLSDCPVPFALFNLCVSVYATHGFEAARLEFEQFLRASTALSEESCHLRRCWVVFFAFLQHHQANELPPRLPPREWRRYVCFAVEKFPFDPLFLRLFVDAETSNTLSQTLRKYFEKRRQAWLRCADSPDLIEWLFALLCEFARAERQGKQYYSSTVTPGKIDVQPVCCVLHRWGKNRIAVSRIRRVFEEMVSQPKTSGSGIAWRLYLRFEVAVGKVDAARRVFYRGLVNCPWSKALYLDGIRVLRPYLKDEECREILDFMAAKELHVRVDI